MHENITIKKSSFFIAYKDSKNKETHTKTKSETLDTQTIVVLVLFELVLNN